MCVRSPLCSTSCACSTNCGCSTVCDCSTSWATSVFLFKYVPALLSTSSALTNIIINYMSWTMRGSWRLTSPFPRMMSSYLSRLLLFEKSLAQKQHRRHLGAFLISPSSRDRQIQRFMIPPDSDEIKILGIPILFFFEC